jgi:hypothetical protein
MLVEVFNSRCPEKNFKKNNLLKVAGPARASRRSIWPAYNDNPALVQEN